MVVDGIDWVVGCKSNGLLWRRGRIRNGCDSY